jgi:hypothetical protein
MSENWSGNQLVIIGGLTFPHSFHWGSRCCCFVASSFHYVTSSTGVATASRGYCVDGRILRMGGTRQDNDVARRPNGCTAFEAKFEKDRGVEK